MIKTNLIKVLPGLFMILLLYTSCTKLQVSKLDVKDIPKSIRYNGSIDTAVRYSDKDGDHIIITTEDKDDKKAGNGIDYRSAGVFACGYKLNGDKWQVIWQLHDLTGPCQKDVTGTYLPGTFAVTDLNKDGRAEVWLMYRIACRGDVSPSDMQVIMREGDKKYAMKGSSRVKINGTDFYGGDYRFDAAFKTGPEVFRQYAQELWRTNLFETFH